MKNEPLLTLNDPFNQSTRLVEILSRQDGLNILCLAGTETSDTDGVSAAGASASQRRLTPSIDADLLMTKSVRAGDRVPVSPSGIVSPVVLSRACLDLLQLKSMVVDCGTFRPPLRTDLTAGNIPGACVSTGEALARDQVIELFKEGSKLAQSLSSENYLLISECVPGGTTTAWAVLKALGVAADGLVSSSLTVSSDVRQNLVDAGLRKLSYLNARGLSRNLDSNFDPNLDPIDILAAVGDPMQPFASGLAMHAALKMPVILAGGSQMLAVYHLCQLLKKHKALKINTELSNLFVVTTRWIANDRLANTSYLSKLLNAPFFASTANLSESKHAGLRAYEDGHVKEGVGAGALMLAASCKLGLTNKQLIDSIDNCYAEIVGDSLVSNSPVNNSMMHVLSSI
jgi:uncharacterized protein (TIGR00303 family)